MLHSIVRSRICWRLLRRAVVFYMYLCSSAEFATEAEYYDQFMDCREPEPNVSSASQEAGLETVHVVFATDFGAFPGLMASMLSLARHLERPGDCVMHVIVDYDRVEHAENLAACFHSELRDFIQPPLPRVQVHSLRQPRLGKRKRFIRLFKLKPFTYARYYLAEYLPDVARALWIDIDVVIKADVAPLYRMPMKTSVAFPFAPKSFSWDYFKQWFADTGSAGLALFHDQSMPPVAPGIMLVDLERWRATNVSRALEDWTMLLHGIWFDLLPLNLHFQGRYDVIDWRWSLCGLGEHTFTPLRCIEDAKLLHFSGRSKPWSQGSQTAHLWKPYAHRRTCEAMPRKFRTLS